MKNIRSLYFIPPAEKMLDSFDPLSIKQCSDFLKINNDSPENGSFICFVYNA